MASNLKNGESEIATVTLRLVDYDKEIKNWQSYSVTSQFLQPCDKFNFRISGEDTLLYQQLLVPGAKVQIAINDAVQCTGYIDDRDIDASSGSGTIISITGRDVLSRMVNANIDPSFKFKTDMTVADVISTAMVPFGFSTLYNSQDSNLNIITGRPNSQSLTTKSVKHQVISYEKNGDGSPKTGADGKYISSLEDVSVTEVVSNIKPGLKKLQIKQYKANVGEGAYAYIQRLIKREGLTLKAAADGSGLMAVAPDYDFDFGYNINLRISQPDRNNVLHANSNVNWCEQPSVIVASGFGTGQEFAKGQLKVIMVNEITGLDENGDYLPEIKSILAKYKKAFLVPIRKELIPAKRVLGTANAFCPMYIVDCEAKDIAQLVYSTTRKMAEHQMKALTLKYTVVGHVDANGCPWAVNTMVNVDDDINDIHERMWVLERTFTKSRSGGTITSLTLIKPHSLQLG